MHLCMLQLARSQEHPQQLRHTADERSCMAHFCKFASAFPMMYLYFFVLQLARSQEQLQHLRKAADEATAAFQEHCCQASFQVPLPAA